MIWLNIRVFLVAHHDDAKDNHIYSGANYDYLLSASFKNF